MQSKRVFKHITTVIRMLLSLSLRVARATTALRPAPVRRGQARGRQRCQRLAGRGQWRGIRVGRGAPLAARFVPAAEHTSACGRAE